MEKERRSNLQSHHLKAKTREDISDIQEYIRENIDENRHARIDVMVKDKENLRNPYSYGKDKDLNPDIYDYIEQQAKLIPSIIQLETTFHGCALSEAEKEEVSQLIVRHCRLQKADRDWDLRASRMLVFGAVMLALYFALSVSIPDGLFLEFISVIGSFALWDAADCFFVERREIQRSRKETEQYENQIIRFADDPVQ